MCNQFLLNVITALSHDQFLFKTNTAPKSIIININTTPSQFLSITMTALSPLLFLQ